jgi:hypothetical protein
LATEEPTPAAESTRTLLAATSLRMLATTGMSAAVRTPAIAASPATFLVSRSQVLYYKIKLKDEKIEKYRLWRVNSDNYL